MAFGKIVVYSGGGDADEFELTKPTTSIGRQPGNDIVLHTSAVSRYHAQFDVADGGVFLVDQGTVNGTFINDDQVTPNARVLMHEGDTIMLGDAVLRFFAPEARSGSKQAALTLTPEARPINAAGVPFRMILDEPYQSVAPGARLQLTLLLDSEADYEQMVDIELGGLESGWVKSNRREAVIEPGAQTQAMISVRPPRSSQTRPGVYALTVRVISRDDPSVSLEAVREIDVVGYGGLGLVIQPGRGGDYHLAVQNQGNQPSYLQLEGYQPDRMLKFHFSAARLEIQPGHTRQVNLSVSPATGRPFGSTQEFEFAVIARSLDKAGFVAPVIGHYTVTPSWPRYLAGLGLPLFFGAGAVFILLILALFYFKVIPWPGTGSLSATETASVTPPEATAPDVAVIPTQVATPVASINSFTALPEQVIFQTNGTVILAWQVSGAESVTVVDSNNKPLPLTEASLSEGRFELLISSLYYGENRFMLTAIGTDGLERSQPVIVQAAAVICSVDSNAQILAQPDPESVASAPIEGDQAVILGRVADASWLKIAYNDLESLTIFGWVLSAQIECQPNSPPFQNYLLIEGVVPAPAITPTPKP